MPTAIALINRMFNADQAERQRQPAIGSEEFDLLRRNEAQRREQLRGILTTREVNDPMALYRAALIMQHSDVLDDVRLAHETAQRAADQDFPSARWLAAASLDRWLMYQAKPQKYGTQIVSDGERQRLWHTDPATTDDERRASGIASLAELEAEAERVNLAEPVPSVAEAPDWLKAGLALWQSGAA